MLPNNMIQTGYTSCIKIFGVPILPPLVTEERRQELNDDKQRAIEIEKRLKGKRSSIDSGVMTGSYIEQFRNSEWQQNSELCLNQVHNLPDKENLQNDVSVTSCEAVDYVVSDSFLKTALEDPEFREFFSSTAEKIFKDNKVQNILSVTDGEDSNCSELKYASGRESEIQCSVVLPESSVCVEPPELIELSFSDSLNQVPSIVKNDTTLKHSEISIVVENTSNEKHMENEPSSPPPSRIRRNSYTLETPSSVLLEHMAKEIESGKEESNKWQILSDKNEKPKGPGFKTFSGRSQRKHWNKKICNPSSNLIAESHRTKLIGRSNTFVKSDVKVGKSNYSLPCSTRTSPLQLCPFTRSVDCIKSIGSNLNDIYKERKGDISVSPECVDKLSTSQIPFRSTISYPASHTETSIVQKDVEVESASVDTSPVSLTNNPSSSVHSIFGTDNSSPPQIEFSDSISQISAATLSTFVQQNSICSRNLSNKDVPNNLDLSEDFDDIASLCSSMSISRFMPTQDISRPSTAGNVSEASISQLKMKHENELRELLEKQRKEEEMYSQLLSSNGSLSTKTTTNLSVDNLFENKFEPLDMDDKRNSCSRELFPFQKSDRIQTKQRDDYSEREKEAAIKLTACAKGYLTRRLLKTEKVQQLIDLIKESLTCAFSLQLEPHLKPNDLELHAHLARQLNAALKELQTIISAPVAARMAIIAADRERLRRPVSRPSSTISTATRRSILRRQQSLNSAEKKPEGGRARTRTKSLSGNGPTGSGTSGSHLRSDSCSTVSSGGSRKPWR